MIEVRLSNKSIEECGRFIGWMDVEIERDRQYWRFFIQQPISTFIDASTCMPEVEVEREGVDYITLYLGEMRSRDRGRWRAFMLDNTRANRDAILKVKEFRPDVEWFRMWQARDQ